MATICFNSYKGGTGKTMTSLNFAANLAKKHKVALIDFDFLGPALFSIFKNEKELYINEAIYGTKEIGDVLIPYHHPKITEGTLSVGIADPRPQAIQSINQLNDSDLKVATGQTLEMQDILENDLDYDYIVIDTGPGLRRDVANAIYISDVIVLVMKPTISDLKGTKLVVEAMIKGYATGKSVGVIFNRALHQNWQPHSSLPEADNDYNKILIDSNKFYSENNIPVFASVNCMCDIARSQADRIFVLDYEEHPYTISIKECTTNILRAFENLG